LAFVDEKSPAVVLLQKISSFTLSCGRACSGSERGVEISKGQVTGGLA